MEIFYNLTGFADWGLLMLRVVVGVIFLVHGTMKWTMWKMQPSSQMSAGMLNTMKFLSIVEPLGGLAMVAGFLTQPAAIGLGLIMLGAIYTKASVMKMPFMVMEKPGWEFDLLILASNVALLFLGAGSISLDSYLFAL